MKIYNPKPMLLVRIQIVRAGEKARYLNLCETKREEVVEFIKTILKDKINPFPEGNRTSVNIRSAIGGNSFKSKSVSFYGLTTEEVYDLIVKSINNEI